MNRKFCCPVKQFKFSGCFYSGILVQIKMTPFKCISCLSSLGLLWFTLQGGLRTHKLDAFERQQCGKLYFKITSPAFPESLGTGAWDQDTDLKCMCFEWQWECQALFTSFALQISFYWPTLLADTKCAFCRQSLIFSQR